MSGAALAAADIQIKNTETSQTRSVVTDDHGHYLIVGLPVGPYEVTVTRSGFETTRKTGVQLVVGQQAKVDIVFSCRRGKAGDYVEDRPPVVNLSTEQVSGLVTERQVKELPLNGRSYDGLLSLNPGVVNYSSQKSGGVGRSNSAIGNMFSVSGRRPQESLFLLNGIEYTSASTINLTPSGASGPLLGVEAVREFNVLTDAYAAEYGKRPGAQVNIVTTSGSNAIHGSGYEFLRNGALDARNFFDQGGVPGF